jgi:phosphosulfolactate synthase
MAPVKDKGAFFPAEVPFVNRPRKVGMTHVLDRLQALDAAQLAYLAPYIDVTKIGWGLPLLLRRDTLRDRIRMYHDVGVQVSTGGTLLEYAVTHGRVPQLLDEARGLGFDIIEISSGIIELSAQQIDQIAEAVRKRGLQLFIEVGKKDIQHQLSLK